MRYEQVTEILRLAINLQGRPGELAITDIQEKFSVSRCTAERMHDAVEATFGLLETATDAGDRRIRWQLRSRSLNGFIRTSPEELADLEAVAISLDQAGLTERATMVRELAVKLRAASFRHSSDEWAHTPQTSELQVIRDIVKDKP